MPHASTLSLPIAAESPRLLWAGLLAGCAAACLLGLYVGPGDLSEPALRASLLELRACRVATAFLSGAALSVAGVLAQAVFHNPLASPSVLGVTSGAALGGKLGLLAHALLFAGASQLPVAPDMLVPVGCMSGALVSLLLLTAIARRIEGKVALLLAGFLLSSLFLSLGSFVITLGQGHWELGRALIGFTLGGVGGAGLRQVLLVLPITVIGTVAAITWSRSLDVLLSGETEASALGVDTVLAKRCCIGLVRAALRGRRMRRRQRDVRRADRAACAATAARRGARGARAGQRVAGRRVPRAVRCAVPAGTSGRRTAAGGDHRAGGGAAVLRAARAEHAPWLSGAAPSKRARSRSNCLAGACSTMCRSTSRPAR